MDNSRVLSLNTNSFVDRNKFDSLRKVAQVHTTEKKIKKWIDTPKIPSYYPRGID